MEYTGTPPELQPSENPADSDAYEQFWNCIEADQTVAPRDTVDPEQSAYEQFWQLVDAD